MPISKPFYSGCLHFQKKMVFIVSDYHKSYTKKEEGENMLIFEAP